MSVKLRSKLERRPTYIELAQVVLEREGAPLAWRDVTAKAQQLAPSRLIRPATMRDRLSKHPAIFMRVERGKYALAKWGYIAPRTYADIVADVLTQVGEPLTYEEVHARVQVERPVRTITLRSLLSNSPRFYKTLSNHFGLRAWLYIMQADYQKIGRWPREEPRSAVRVPRAEARGYKTASLIRPDLMRLNGELSIAAPNSTLERTYMELAEIVLGSEGAELHWTEILARAQSLDSGRRLNPNTMLDRLRKRRDRFVNLGRGMFTLSRHSG